MVVLVVLVVLVLVVLVVVLVVLVVLVLLASREWKAGSAGKKNVFDISRAFSTKHSIPEVGQAARKRQSGNGTTKTARSQSGRRRRQAEMLAIPVLVSF